MTDHDEIEQTLRQFIATELLHGDAAELRSDTPLMETGILDSISTVTLIAYLESTYGIRIMPGDIQQDNLGSLAAIARFVQRKRV